MSGVSNRLYLGSYTAASGGKGLGISVLKRDAAGSPWNVVQVAVVDDPSFLALTEGELHAVSETVAGRLVSFTISAGVLEPASVAATGGAAPCHVVVDPSSGSLVVTNYTAGTFAAVSADALDPARVARVLPLPGGTGPAADRQEAPHAHSATPTPWGTLLIADLGTDWIYEVRIDPTTLEPAFVAAHAVPAGSGPRHLAWLGSSAESSLVESSSAESSSAEPSLAEPSLVVAGELDGRVHVLTRVDGRLEVDYSVEAYDLATSPAPGTGEALLSHLEVHDGRVYVAVRGRDTIAVLAPGSSGRLELVAEVPCGGRWPRHFAFSGAELYVANQLSHTVSVLPVAAESGVPGAPTQLIETGSPACVVFG